MLVMVLGLLSGGINAGLLRMINKILNLTEEVPITYLWTFAVLLILLPLAKYFSDSTTNALFIPIQTGLMRNFLRKFMTLPIREIEKNGIAKYHAALNEDIRTLFGALRSLVFIGMHGTIVIFCLIYLAWLSLPTFGWTLLRMAIGMVLHRMILVKAMSFLAVGREGYGEEIVYFQSIAQGIKELKLHSERRNAFFETMVEPTFKKMMRNLLIGHNIFAVGAGLSAILDFVVMGSLLFGSMLVFNVEQEVLSGYALAVMFMFGPIELFCQQCQFGFPGQGIRRKDERCGFSSGPASQRRYLFHGYRAFSAMAGHQDGRSFLPFW